MESLIFLKAIIVDDNNNTVISISTIRHLCMLTNVEEGESYFLPVSRFLGKISAVNGPTATP